MPGATAVLSPVRGLDVVAAREQHEVLYAKRSCMEGPRATAARAVAGLGSTLPGAKAEAVAAQAARHVPQMDANGAGEGVCV